MSSCAMSAQSSVPTETSEDARILEHTPDRFRPFVLACDPWDDWDKPAPPFRIHANTYHVGTCGISAILITGDEGHILIDGGTEGGANVIAANIAALGLSIEDVRYILHSHEHFDHVAGIAELQRLSGAKLIASPRARPVLESGVVADDDPQAGMHDPFPSARVFQTIEDGGTVRLGPIEATAIFTPGHSPGAISWQWKSCTNDDAGTDCKTIAYADSLSPVSRDGYRFGDHTDYLAAYINGLERLGQLECDVILTPHPSHSRMLHKMRTDGMTDPASCGYYATGKLQDIERRLAGEKAAGARN